MKNYFPLLFTGSVLLLAGCGENKVDTASAASPAPASSASVAGNPPAPNTPADDFLMVSGPLIVEHQIDVASQRDGIVAAISVNAGDRVKAGKVLAQLDDRQVAANLEAARARTRSLEADLKNWQADSSVMQADYVRAQKMFDLKILSEEQLEHARYKVESDRWDILKITEQIATSKQEERSLELEREKTSVTAPFDGLVGRRYVRAGQSVTRGDKLFWITAEAPLLLRFTLPEKYVGHLKSGQTLALTSPDVPLEKHSARIKELSPVVDPASGTIEVLAELLGERGGLRPGMTASVRIDNPR